MSSFFDRRHIPDFSSDWFKISGKDTTDFFQRLTTVNFQTLTENGVGQWGAFLNAQGKVESFFRVWKSAPATFLFELQNRGSYLGTEAFLSTVDRMTFGEELLIEKLKIDASIEWTGLLPASPPPETLVLKTSSDASTGIMQGERNELTRWLGANTFKEVHFQDYELSRVLSLTPAVGKEIILGSSLMECGIPEAIHENKGCYPGQEVVERIRSLGAPAHRLVLIETQKCEGPEIQITSEIAGHALGFVHKRFAQVGAPTQKGKIQRIAPIIHEN
jgi:folate-binding protein YgfZ